MRTRKAKSTVDDWFAHGPVPFPFVDTNERPPAYGSLEIPSSARQSQFCRSVAPGDERTAASCSPWTTSKAGENEKLYQPPGRAVVALPTESARIVSVGIPAPSTV